jgi:hypothetical protein|tara:strand:- start:4626 stop:4748 length:123 start_codon:yes stop_codon:yes gene_type:complete
MELLINVVFGLLLGVGIGAMLSMTSALIWMFWDMFKPKKR